MQCLTKLDTTATGIAGSIRYTGNDFEGYLAGEWLSFTSASGAAVVSDKISEGDTSVECVDAGTGYVITKTDDTERMKIDENGVKLFNTGVAIQEFSNDTALAGDSDLAVPTEKAVKAYVDAASFTLVDDTTPQLGGNLDVNGFNINYGAILTGNGTYKGDIMTVTVDDASTAFGNALYCAADFHYERCDADADATMPCRALALEAGAGSKMILLKGQICNTSWDWSAGTVWTSLTTGEITQTLASGTGDQVQEIGFALSADTIYFSPVSIIAEVE